MEAGNGMLFIGGYTPGTGGSGTGLTVVRREGNGELKALAETAATGPSFLAFHPRLPIVYAVLECEEGGVAAFSADAEGPALLAEGPSGGSYPCHVAVDPSGTWLSVANYGDGTVAVFRLGSSGLFDGRPHLFPGEGHGADPARQAGPHAHQSTFGPGRTLYATDLGTDRIRRFTTGAAPAPHPDGPVIMPAGMGPRHMARRDGRWYVAGELDGAIRVYDDGWRELGAVPATGSAGRNLVSHIDLSPDGRHLYAANRGPDTIAVFGFTGDGGLTLLAEVGCGGLWPRHFTVAGDHMYVANQRSDNVAVLALHDGVPVPTGLAFEVGSPSCVLPAPV
ncbi:beta-propeller fold lactonase family protein [Sphaerisporangium rubeum]|uniref:6-phosphogluconolactonase (Cycloisomerase 2 family) n=1 Tax=Sphaerisporangium rubeum TaxID=321317 RepID=A0A7X0IG45_9ACTN|nr:lactonase family protein [Sphaerisporangium rubeum]MBB6474615.1 6-phosphogluconolactonase (cycloisomerase 2 family) [Sphaerisporangium rubeum]